MLEVNDQLIVAGQITQPNPKTTGRVERTTAEPQRDSGLLRRLWRVWKRFAKRIGNFQARVFLAVFYFTFFCLFALAVRWTSDPLAIKGSSSHGWLPIVSGQGSLSDRARRQF
jgi:hypothetical protein